MLVIILSMFKNQTKKSKKLIKNSKAEFKNGVKIEL